MKLDLVELMNDSRSIIDLEEKLRSGGLEFPTYKEYIDWLSEEWTRISAPRLKEILDSPPPRLEFPTLVVSSRGVEYHLHGVGHHNPLLGSFMKKNVRGYINRTMASFHRPDKGEDYLYEEGFYAFFDLLREREVRDVTLTRPVARIKRPSFLRIITAVFLTLAAIPIPLSFTKREMPRIRHDFSQALSGQYSLLVKRALTDELYQSRVVKCVFVGEMPQPFNLEVNYLYNMRVLEGRTSLERVIALMTRYKPVAERSRFTSFSLTQSFLTQGLNRVHYLGGAGHTTEIAYFIKNPGYSLERLEKYRLQRENRA